MTLIAFVSHHAVLLAMVAWWLLSAVIDGMPPPPAGCGMAYTWLYLSCHVFAGNVTRAIRARFPGVPLVQACSVDSSSVASAGERPSEPPPVSRPADHGGSAE
jgi:hypothetical protein